MEYLRLQELKLHVNDEEQTVKLEDVTNETTLNTYIRHNANLTGTKIMCGEGGCGACVVAVTFTDPITKRDVTMSVNSCLIPIYLCSGWKIHTVEKIGDKQNGYHPVQKSLVQFNGTQCGYCSSGMIMNMFALYESGEFKMKDVENSFGGNICRCTGYRPILSAFKSLASDASSELLGHIADIEDIPVCKKTNKQCSTKCLTSCKSPQAYYHKLGKTRWYKVFSLNEVLDVIRQNPQNSYMLVGGNTAKGVYKITKQPDIMIDINSVKLLKDHTIDNNNLVLGANMSLTNAMELFYKLAKEHANFKHLEKMADHIDLIANVPVRNTGTLAGNLFTKHEYHEFPSDIYLILESIGATVTIVGTDHQEKTVSPHDFLSFDMNSKVIKSITIPALDSSYKYESYKIMPRAQNAHALVNAGFLLKLDGNNKVEKARIVYGSINSSFDHATNAEQFLAGKNLFDDNTLQGVFQALHNEISPDQVKPDPSPEFRKKLAIALFYKYVLSIAPSDKVSPRNKSGGSILVRPVSTGTQDYDTNESLYPITKPISKIEALAQSTGQAQYIMDIPDYPGQLYAAFVLANAAPSSVISKIDPSPALEIDGVIAFFGKEDIPGVNDFMPKEGHMTTQAEELFCSGTVKYYYQPLGMIVATTQEVAEKATEAVIVNYTAPKNKPLISVRDILATKAKNRIFEEGVLQPTKKGDDVKHVIKGKFDISFQYHYTMETQCCVVIPNEDGLDMHPATQTMTLSQVAAAKVLNIPANKIHVDVRRLGGAYGSKISRNAMVSSAAALAAYKLHKPVKFALPLTTNMKIIGKRHPLSTDYEVGVDSKGVVQYLNANLYSDLGSDGGNENVAGFVFHLFGNMYNKEPWQVNMYSTRTDTPNSTWCRAPGTTEAIASTENIFQHIAVSLDLDPIQVRLNNLAKTAQTVTKYVEDLTKWAEVEKRKSDIAEFNKNNRWIKRGLAVVPMLYPQEVMGYYHAHVAIYQADGTVCISHGGIEMGQGINTKVAQVCAHELSIPLENIVVKPSNSLIAPNSQTSGGSFTSEAVCLAIINACNILKERMEPVKKKMKDPTWIELVQQNYKENVDLAATSLYTPNLPEIKKYSTYGATCAEVEVDILTGLYQARRVDILEDTGNSLSPQIDIGQVEGAFIMGIGYWTCEQIVFGDEGQLLTTNTWTYKPPGAKDIPIDLRVKFPKNNPNNTGVYFSKATAEPPLCMSVCVPFAIRDAVASARKEADSAADKWYPIDGPSTVENTFLNGLHDYRQYKL